MSPKMTFVKFLGKGTYGSVELFSYKENNGSLIYNAVKISDHHDSLDKEFKILKKLKDCPRIIQLFGQNSKTRTLLEDIDYNGKKVYKMPMEYASAGTLTSYIKRNRGKLSDSIIKHFTIMILQGLVSIHSHGYVHCDLKPDNLLLFPRYDEETWNCSYELKISDFGLSTKSGEKSDVWEKDSPFVGSPVYMSPESVKDGLVEETLDLWSLGCVVFEMYIGTHPWIGFSTENLKTLLVSNGNLPRLPKNVPCDARKFLETCFARKPLERGSAKELLLHPFLIGGDEVSGGEKRRVGFRVRKQPERFEDIATKTSKLKVISTKAQQFKKVSKRPPKVKILPPRPPKI